MNFSVQQCAFTLYVSVAHTKNKPIHQSRRDMFQCQLPLFVIAVFFICDTRADVMAQI
jgi:hypothetical protein